MAMVASASTAAAASITPPSSFQPPQFHVLAVDDSVLDRKLIESLLRTSSYHVTAVDSVTKALEFLGMQQQQGGPAPAPSCSCSSSSSYYFHQQEISLIITDYSMPGMTGYDLLKTIKGSGSPLRDIPVVIMSSENVPARINRCLEEGADEFFLKPVKLSDISKLRPHVLRGKSTAAKDQEEGSPGNSQDQELQESQLETEQGQQQHQQWQQILLPEQVIGDAVADTEVAATDSPRSYKRKAAQRGGDSHQDQRTRTSYPRYDVCL